jgi:hypothetical protein
MKAFAAFLGCALIAASAAEVEWPRLVGIVNVTNKPQALLVMPRAAAPGPWLPDRLQLHSGEAANGFEVLTIDPALGRVRLRETKSSQTTELKLARLEHGQNYALHFEGVPLTSAIDTYQILSGRTVIHSPQLGRAEIHAHIPALESAEVLAALAKALETHDTWLIPYADKYAFALPGRHKALAESMPAMPTVDSRQLIPPGFIKFVSAEVLQVLDFYADLSQRTVLRPNHLVRTPLTFHSQTPLSREEAIWILEAALRLGALITVPAGDKFVFVVPPSQVNGLPKFDPARQLPGSAGLMNLVEVDRGQVLETYGALTGRKPLLIDPALPYVKFNMRTPAPLNPAEAAFALEALAVLNNLAFQPVGDNEIKLIPLAELREKD